MAYPKGAPRPAGSGRKKGTPNKINAELKSALQKHAPAMLKSLIALTKSDNEQVRLAALREAYDRLYGKARQPVGGDETAVPIEVIHRVVVGSREES